MAITSRSITFNEIGKKVESDCWWCGSAACQDPKAFPRKSTAECRWCRDWQRNTFVRCYDLQSIGNLLIRMCALAKLGIEGIAGIELKLVQGDHADPDVGMDFVFGDDWFTILAALNLILVMYVTWALLSGWISRAAIELFPDKEEELRTLMVETGFDLTTHADREYKWIYVNEKRLRLVEIWYQHKGKWVLGRFSCS